MLRLTSGLFRGRMIEAPLQRQTRPTQARLRQALFNSLQTQLGDSRVLDLFAGSGALGFEALSRGSSHVTFVETSRPAIRLIEKNAENLGVTHLIQVIGSPIFSALTRLRKAGPFNLILADPPYEVGWELKLLYSWPWEDLLSPEGYFCLEWGSQKSQVSELPEKVACLQKVREKHYGNSVLSTYLRKS